VKKAKGNLYVSINLDCPECGEYLDLFEIDSANDDQQLWKVIECWRKDGAWESIEQEITCPKCKNEFLWDSLEY
jgi:hypothetical protein